MENEKMAAMKDRTAAAWSSCVLNSFHLCCGEVFCAGAGGDAPDDQERDPEDAVEVLDPGDTQCADYAHGCADDDDPGPGWAFSVRDGVEDHRARDAVDCIPAGRGDHGEDHYEEVAPVSKGVSAGFCC